MAFAYAEADAKAEALTAAKIHFRKSDPAAGTDWSGAGDDSEKFRQLRPFLQGTAVGLTLRKYVADTPYDQFDFEARLRDRVTLNSAD